MGVPVRTAGADDDWRKERDPSTFVVTGGAAFAVNTEAMEAAKGALDAAARDIESSRARLESARRAVWRGACAGSAAAARFDLDAAGLVGEAARAGLGASRIAQATAAARAAYEMGEFLRATPWAGLQFAGLWAARQAPLALAPASPVALGALLDPAGHVSRALRVGGALVGIVGWPNDRISIVRNAVRPGTGDPATFAYAGESLRQAQGTVPLEDGTEVPPSSVIVERFPRPDGSTAVMLTVPGTQSWDPDDESGNVFDSEGNLDALAGADSHARQLIERALADQELGGDDVVIVNAHSQGALHVFGLLEDERFRARYPIAAVTVLGGAPRQFDVPEDVAVLHLSNVDDPLPSISGRPLVPRPNIVDVVTPAHADRDLWQPLQTIVNAHAIDRYAHDANALDRSRDPSVLAYAAGLGLAVGGAASAPRERIIYTASDTTTAAAPQITPRAVPAPSGPAAPPNPAGAGRRGPGRAH